VDRVTNLEFSDPNAEAETAKGFLLENSDDSTSQADELWTEDSPQLVGPLCEPEPVKTASDIIGVSFWAFSKSHKSFRFSDSMRSLLGLNATQEDDFAESVDPKSAAELTQSLVSDERFKLMASRTLSGGEPSRLLIEGWPEYRGSDRIVGFGVDVPLETTVNAKSQETDPLFLEAMEYGPDSLMILRAVRNELGDPVDFEVVESNSKGANLLGCSRKDAKGQLVGRLLPEAREDGTIAGYAEVMRKGALSEREFHVSPGGFQRIWIKQRVIPLQDGVAVFATDVSGSRLADETVDRSRRMFERIATTTPDGLMLWDVDTRRLIYQNGRLAPLLGLKEQGQDGVVSLSFLEEKSVRTDRVKVKGFIDAMSEAKQDEVSEEVFELLSAPSDTRRLLLRSSVFELKANGRPKTILTVVQDVTEQARNRSQLEAQMTELAEARLELETRQRELVSLNAQLSDMALTDPITGIKNRRAFQEKLDEETERAQRYNSRLALVLADVDHFKRYNDRYGHPAGDLALKAFSQVLVEVCRRSDTVARYGGEEFAIILPNTGAIEAGFLSERVRSALARTLYGQQGLTASFGCAEYVSGKEGREKLVAETDKALYQSKNAGRDRVTMFKP
jgi:diguanylate cyclase (GGDEF)-like protein